MSACSDCKRKKKFHRYLSSDVIESFEAIQKSNARIIFIILLIIVVGVYYYS